MKNNKEDIMEAHSYYMQERYREAVILYEDLINKKGGLSITLQKEYAICLQKNMRYTEGIHVTRKILKSEPADTDMLLNMCVCLGKLNKYEAALRYYERILKIRPKYITQIGYYAYLLGKTGEHEKANHYYELALKKEPNNVWYISHYAYFLQEIKKYQKSEKFFIDAMEREPDNSWILKRYAYFLYETEGKDAAYGYYAQLIKKDSANCNVYINFAELAMVLSDEDRALKLLGEAEQLEKSLVINVILLFYWAVYHLCNRNYEELERTVEKLLLKRKEYTGFIHRDFIDLDKHIHQKTNVYQKMQYQILLSVLREGGEQVEVN